MTTLGHKTDSLEINDASSIKTDDILTDAELDEREHDQLVALRSRHLSEVLEENPSLAAVPKPFGSKSTEGINESFLSIRVEGLIVGFVSYAVEGHVVNETGVYVDRPFRGHGYSLRLLEGLLSIAQHESARAIYFYNLTKAGNEVLRKFQTHILKDGKHKTSFSYEKNVVAITIEDIIGCSSFEEGNKLLPCFFPYGEEPSLMVLDAMGNYIYTDKGRLLDLNSGYWCSPFGYRNGDLEKASSEGYFTHLFGYLHPSAISLAQRLCELTGMTRVGFNTSGSSVIDSAIRLAWQYSRVNHPERPGRDIVVSLNGGFYGSSSTALEASGQEIYGYEYNHFLPDRDVRRKIDPFSTSLNPLKDLLDRENLHERVAAFIFEPVLGVRGAHPLEEVKLRRMLDTCREYDIIAIADEISTGMGRTGEMFACDHYKVRPDILCLGKPLTNGMFPLAAVLFNEKINGMFLKGKRTPSDFLYGSTLSGHPTGCMIALKVIDLLTSTPVLQRIEDLGGVFQRRLSEFQNRFEIVRGIHGVGLMLGVELLKSRIAREVQTELRRHRINCIPEGNTLMLMPPYTITDEEVAYSLNALEKSLAEANVHYSQRL